MSEKQNELHRKGNILHADFHIVLHHPEIPQNTGNIGRICVCTNCALHLIEPLGFLLDDKHIKRSGMDYWQHVPYTRHASWEKFLETKSNAPIYFFSTKGEKTFWDCPMEDGAYFVFGSESCGLPDELHEKYKENFYTIPMPGKFNRSLNLANSVAVAVYEGLRKKKDRS